MVEKPEINMVDFANDLYELTHADKSIHQIFELLRNEKKKNNEEQQNHKGVVDL